MDFPTAAASAAKLHAAALHVLSHALKPEALMGVVQQALGAVEGDPSKLRAHVLEVLRYGCAAVAEGLPSKDEDARALLHSLLHLVAAALVLESATVIACPRHHQPPSAN